MDAYYDKVITNELATPIPPTVIGLRIRRRRNPIDNIAIRRKTKSLPLSLKSSLSPATITRPILFNNYAPGSLNIGIFINLTTPKLLSDTVLKPSPEPTPKPSPEPTPELTLKPSPEPILKPSPEATPEPTPKPSPEATPEPTFKPSLKATPKPSLEATLKPIPKLFLKATPEPTPKLTPKPSPEATPPPNTATKGLSSRILRYWERGLSGGTL
ncbi:hypothetical protein QBC39DRAFT_326824 [Podospora conica]|nr:hypothetical protein QBC39DRAFT_326824 [Schizothecium conicum]